MSQFLTCKTQIRNEACLVAALVALGFPREQIEVHAKPQSLYGYRGEVRPEQAHVIIRRQHVRAGANDIGFLRGPDGTYSAIISEFDRGQGNDAAWLGRLQQLYALQVVTRQAAAKGYIMHTTKRQDGTLRVVAQVR